MSLIVAKFGGTSVASPERIKKVAARLIAKKQAGHSVVAVVSAMGKTTDELVSLASALNGNPPAREMDRLLSTGEQVSMALLAMALEARGYRAMSFTGRQAGIETDTSHLKSKITGIDAKRIMDAVGIPTAPWRDIPSYTESDIPALCGELEVPCAVKVVNGGSSIGVALPDTKEELAAALR